MTSYPRHLDPTYDKTNIYQFILITLLGFVLMIILYGDSYNVISLAFVSALLLAISVTLIIKNSFQQSKIDQLFEEISDVSLELEKIEK